MMAICMIDKNLTSRVEEAFFFCTRYPHNMIGESLLSRACWFECRRDEVSENGESI